MPEVDDSDPEVDALQADADAKGWHGYYARTMEGDVRWYESPERERCGGGGYIRCYCGGDLCVCGNQGEIDCVGCEDCDPDEDWDDELADCEDCEDYDDDR